MMAVEINVTGEVVTAYISGELDHHSARFIREEIDSAVEFNMPTLLILNFEGVSFMDSSGLGLILGRFTKATELGIVFKVQNPTPQIKRILDLAGTERLVKIENNSQRRQTVR